jgi:hypothetical protein
MTRKRAREERLRAQLSAAFPSVDPEDAAELEDILILMKRGMAGGKHMPPATSRLIQKAPERGETALLKAEAVLLKAKAKKRAAMEDRTIKAHNLKRQQDAGVRRQRILEIATRLNRRGADRGLSTKFFFNASGANIGASGER